MRITPRDRKIFKHLSDYGMLTTKQINSITFNGVAATTVLRRLRILEEEKLIKRLLGLNSGEPLWIITEKALEFFEGGEHFKRFWNKNMLEHDFKLLNLRLLLEERGIAKSWEPEHKIRFLVFRKYKLADAKNKLVPDGLMVTESYSKKLAVAIELELTLKNRDRLKDVLKRYLDKKDLHYLWYICGSKLVANAVLDTWNKMKGSNLLRLKVSLFSDVMSNPTAHCPAQGVSNQSEGWPTTHRGLSHEIQKSNSLNYSPPI